MSHNLFIFGSFLSRPKKEKIRKWEKKQGREREEGTM
jgi:hypothetical protein